METLKSIISEPAVIILLVELVALVVAKLDKKNKVAGLIIKLGKALESKENT